MLTHHRYARIERERRFLLGDFPHGQPIVRMRRIKDRYIEGTNLRLREQRDDGSPPVFKLTQKIPAPASAAQQGYITTMYLDRDTHERLSQLSANILAKRVFEKFHRAIRLSISRVAATSIISSDVCTRYS